MYSEAFVRGILESYEAAMDSLLKAKYISEVSVLSQNGADTIAEFNNTACEYDRSKTDVYKRQGDGVLTGYTRDYIRVSMLGAPVIGIGLMMVNYLGVENHPELALSLIHI